MSNEQKNTCYHCKYWNTNPPFVKGKCTSDCLHRGWTTISNYTCPSFVLKKPKQYNLDLGDSYDSIQ